MSATQVSGNGVDANISSDATGSRPGGDNINISGGASYEKMLEKVLRSMNAYSIVLSILATLSYTAILQPPKPLDPHQSEEHTWQNLFFSFNCLCFFLSVCGLVFYASTSFWPMMVFEGSSSGDQEKTLAMVLPIFVYINIFCGLSLACCVIAYVCACLATVHHKTSEMLSIILPCVIGGLFYLQAMVVCIPQAYQPWPRLMKQHTELWNAIKKGTLFGKSFAWYISLISARANEAQGVTQGRANEAQVEGSDTRAVK